MQFIFKKRVANLMIDMFLISLLINTLELVYPSAYVSQFKEINGELIQTAGYEKVSNRGIVISALSLLIFTCYYALQELFYGKTIGKFFTKTSVVTVDGSP